MRCEAFTVGGNVDPGITGNRANLMAARECYREAREVFSLSGDSEKARVVAEAGEQIERELLSAPPIRSTGPAGNDLHRLN